MHIAGKLTKPQGRGKCQEDELPVHLVTLFHTPLISMCTVHWYSLQGCRLRQNDIIPEHY